MQHFTRAMLALTFGLAACSDGVSITGAESRAALVDLRTHDFAVLANAAVTCTDGTIRGDVGTDQATPTGSFTQTQCPVEGSIHIGDGAARAAYDMFLATYANLALTAGDDCTLLTGTLDGVTLAPGTYCFDAAAALTGTNFTVVLSNGADACNITWWVSQAATLTTSNFQGSILAGAAITLTGGSFNGNAWSMADVTITGTAVNGCATSSGGNGPGGNDRERCNQGVGNGAEGCDPGNSNNRRPSNDETGGTPGNPGRKGGR